MKNKQSIFAAILSIMLFIPLSSLGQTIETNTTQQFTVTGPQFIPFSSISNDSFKNNFEENMILNVTISNFLGGPCNLAAAADFKEIGTPTTLTGGGIFPVDFSMSSDNASLFGLSFSPLNTPCTFDLLVTPPASTSSSSSSGETSEGLTPNSITIYATVLSQELTDQLSNEQNNPQCQNSPNGINGTPLQNDAFFDQLFDELLSGDSASQEVEVMGAPVKPVRSIFTLVFPDVTSMSQNQKDFIDFTVDIINMTDKGQIIVTGVFPTFVDTGSSMSRVDSLDLDIDLKEQSGADLIALGAVQHALISASMPWQLSQNGGFFITQGGGCVGPFCTIVEAGMVIIDPNGACTPDKLNRRKAGYPTVNPSKFFDPFPNSASVIQIPAKDIVNPKHPLVAKTVRNNAYFIFQPAPAKSHLVQKVKVKATDKKEKNN